MAKQSVEQGLLRIKSLEKKGDLQSARQLCQEMIAAYPANPRLRQAWAALGQARARPPAVPVPGQDALQVLVEAFNRQQYRAVLDHGGRLARQHAQSPVLFNILASAAAKLGETDLAIRHYRRAIELNPQFLDAMNNLGHVAKDARRWDVAAEALAQSLRLRPDQAVIWRSLGQIEAGRGQKRPAIAAFERARAALPDDLETLDGLSKVQAEADDVDGALATMRHAIALAPENPEILVSLGVALGYKGLKAEAFAAYEKALRLRPGMGKALRGISVVYKFTAGDPLIAQIEAAYAKASETGDRCRLAFALSKVCEDLGDDAGTVKYLKEANHLQRSMSSYRFQDDTRLFEALRRTAPMLLHHALPRGVTPMETVPIFIVAMPRSGTTLVEQILSRHPEVAGGGELDFLRQLGMALANGEVPVTYDRLRDVRAGYLSAIRPLAQGKPFLTDKMPHNFRLVALIRAALPEAKIIHIKREPAAVCWSNFRQFFRSDTLGYSADLHELAQFYGMYAGLMAQWKASFGGAIHTLDYDRLTVEQEDETRKVLDYLGLPWEDACLAPQDNARPVRTVSALQVKQAVYQGSSQEWMRFAPYLDGAFDTLPR